MTTPILALLLFVAWTLLLVILVISARSAWFLMGRKRANEFPAGERHGPDLYWRLNRAHLNAVENLPIFAALVVAGQLLGTSTGTFATLAAVVPAARVTQTLAHLSSGSEPAVLVRFSAFIVQIACFAGMAGILLLGGVHQLS